MLQYRNDAQSDPYTTVLTLCEKINIGLFGHKCEGLHSLKKVI